MEIFSSLYIGRMAPILTLVIYATLAAAMGHVGIYQNPLVLQRADPHISRHTDGWYYYVATVPEFDRIILRRSQTLQGLSNASETTIWNKVEEGEGTGPVWAPELHFIDGNWYIYVALGIGDSWTIRMHVLECGGTDPLACRWTQKGVTKTNWDTFTLDASTFVANGTRYLVWAQEDPTWGQPNTSIMLAPLQNPWTISGTAVAISRPVFEWEKRGYSVNEGPGAIVKDGKIFITYSASATDHNYAMGLLSVSTSVDIMDPSSWTKSPGAVFQSSESTGQWGPGHSSFTTSEDGQSDILVYHSRPYRDVQGSPLSDPNRHTRLQKIYWAADGNPNFGVPVPDGLTPSQLHTLVNNSHVIHHDGNGRILVGSNISQLADSQFRVVSGLAGNNTISLESTNNPGSYIRHRDFSLRLDKLEESSSYYSDASFVQHDGGISEQGVSFEASNFPGHFIRWAEDGGVTIAIPGETRLSDHFEFIQD